MNARLFDQLDADELSDIDGGDHNCPQCRQPVPVTWWHLSEIDGRYECGEQR